LQLVGIVSLVLCAIALDTVTAWGLGGSIGLVVVGLLGMVGGFGRFKWMITLVCHTLPEFSFATFHSHP
jgi:hypothetical protein